MLHTTTSLRIVHRDDAAFTIPQHWACTKGNIVEFVRWYMNRLGHGDMSAATKAAWAHLETKIAFVNKTRPLTIHVLAEDASSPLLNNAAAVINVHSRGLNAHARALYNTWEVTGVDFNVQAVLVSQSLTADVLYDACRAIELQELDTFTFVCSHATHRSCGCAVLLAILVYHHARIIFSTNKTRRAARERGMEEGASSKWDDV